MIPGTLYVVATPLGHLGDLSARAADVLRTVPVVAAEDTRRSRGLLHHLGASPRLLSFHAHSTPRRVATLLEVLREGRDVALVSDAGTPAISDPGADLVRAVRDAGGRVVPIPGPSAVAAALSAAGLPADRYLFLGFLPRKGGERDRLLRRAASEEWTVVFFEAPARLTSLLGDLAAVAGPDRDIVVAREFTKVHEEFRCGPVGDVLAGIRESPLRGECTVLLRGTGQPEPAPDRSALAGPMAAALLAEGHTRREIVGMLTERLGLARNEAYRLVQELP